MAKFLAKNLKAGVILLAALALLAIRLQRNNENPNPKEAIRTVEITYSLIIRDIPERAEDVRVWVPVPPTNKHQKLLSLDIPGDMPYQMLNEPEYGNQFLVFDLTDISLFETSQVGLDVNFLVTRRAIRPLLKNSSANSTAQRQLVRFLAADRLVPIGGKIAEEAHSTAGNTWKPLQQSRLLYDHIVSSISYDKSGTGWGRGDALYACNIRKGNCTDFHSLFIAQSRALGIPARFIMGLSLPEEKREGTIAGYHCWAEFYLSDKGWIPIDASEASKYPEKKEQYFGGLDEHRIAFTLGRDIKLPGSAAEPVNYVIYPYVEIDGLSHSNIQTTFYFKDYPLRNRAIEKLPSSKVSIN